MSAAKKAGKVSVSQDSSPEPKEVAEEKAKLRLLDPLPEDEVGPRLLVRLQAEKVMKKLKLKERWEDQLGWNFDELCAVVAATLGKKFMIEGEADLVKRVRKFRAEKAMLAIEAIAKFPENKLNRHGKLASEFYVSALMLGIGTTKFSIQGNPKLSKTEQLCDALSKALKVDSGIVDDRVWERAKNYARERYAEHLKKSEERIARLGHPVAKKQVVMTGRSNISLLREVFGQLALEGKLPSIKGPLPKPLATAAVVRAGMKRLGYKGPAS